MDIGVGIGTQYGGQYASGSSPVETYLYADDGFSLLFADDGATILIQG